MDERNCREVSWLSLESGECQWSKRRRSYSSGDKLRQYKSYPLLPTELLLERGTMAPGTSSMLRARRRDVNVKPNRVLDRNSSRGMIFENEELRLRTININAEVERGQSDIKKLRRENDQLRREIWNLRDEYDRLESLLKAKSQNIAEDEEDVGKNEGTGGDEEEEEEEEEDEDEEGEDSGGGGGVEEGNKANDDIDHDSNNKVKERDNNNQSDGLSVVEEESEDVSDTTEERPKVVSFKTEELETQELEPVTADRTGTREFSTGSPTFQELFKKVTTESPVRTTGGSEVVTTAILQRRQSFAQSGNQTKDTITCTASTTTTLNGIYMQTQCEPYIGPGPQFLRLNSIQPYTIVFPVTSPQLNNLLVQEVIDTLSEQLPNKLMNSLKGVRLIGGNCFLSFSNQPDAEYVLHLPLTLRGLPVLLEDASIGTTVLSLNGVPHNIDDDTVISVLSNFGNIVGGVERRLYKGVDTGERLVRLKARVSVPQTLWIGGCKASLRVLSDTEITSLALTRRKSFRSHINVHLQPLCFEQTDSKQFPFEHNIVSTPSVSTAQDIIDVYMVSPDSTTQREQGTLLQKKTEAPTPFIFPTVPQYSSTPNLPVQEIRQTGNITLNSLQPGSPDTFHIRSHSTPPCASNLSKTEISNSQPNTPASPVIYKRSSQRHRASKKVPKVNIESKKLTAECSQSSSSGQDSPTKPEKRRASVYFKREKQGNSILSRTTSSEQGDRNTEDITTTCSERERSNSDVSSRISICKRKMSTTGRETGKVPWCGCWGNGCI